MQARLVLGLAVTMALPAISFGDGAPFGPAHLVGQAVDVKRQANLFPAGFEEVTGTVVANPPGVRTGTFKSGIFGLTYDEPPAGGTYTPFQAICVDANQNLFSDHQLYYFESLASYPSFGPSTDPPAPILSDERKKLLEQLFTIAWLDAHNTATKSAAFQWAAWEIARETQGGSTGGSTLNLKLDAGVINISQGASVLQQANTYLTAITSATFRTPLLILSPVQQLADGTYQRVSGQELLTPVPEPRDFVLLTAGVLALLYTRHKRSGSAA